MTVTYIEDLIENGTNFQVQRGEGTASFTPASDDDHDVEAFQRVVRDLRLHEGEGYSIHIDHVMSDRGGSLIDLVMVTFDGD